MIKRLIISLRRGAQTRKSIKPVIDCDLLTKLIVSALTLLARLISTVSRCRDRNAAAGHGRDTSPAGQR